MTMFKKTFFNKLALLALTGTMLTTGLSVAAMADDDRAGMRTHEREASGFRAGERFARADSDGDRMISLEEYQSRVGARFTTLDADGDGLVTPAELVAERERRSQERAAAHLARIDTDGDGALSLEEMTAASQARFARLDRDEDGSLEPREMRRGMRGAEEPRREGGDRERPQGERAL